MTKGLIDDETGALVRSLAGHRIERAEWWDDAPEGGWTGHEFARLHLDDGRVIEFGGWGHDAWGATANLVELVNVADCRRCHQSHPESTIYRSDSEMRRGPVGNRFAFCVDGNSVAWREDLDGTP